MPKLFSSVMAAYKRPKDERAPFVEEALHGAAEVRWKALERAHAMQAGWTRCRFRRVTARTWRWPRPSSSRRKRACWKT